MSSTETLTYEDWYHEEGIELLEKRQTLLDAVKTYDNSMGKFTEGVLRSEDEFLEGAYTEYCSEQYEMRRRSEL